MAEARGRTRRSRYERPEQIRRAQRLFREKQRDNGIRPIQITMPAELLRMVEANLKAARLDGRMLSRSELCVELIERGLR